MIDTWPVMWLFVGIVLFSSHLNPTHNFCGLFKYFVFGLFFPLLFRLLSFFLSFRKDGKDRLFNSNQSHQMNWFLVTIESVRPSTETNDHHTRHYYLFDHAIIHFLNHLQRLTDWLIDWMSCCLYRFVCEWGIKSKIKNENEKVCWYLTFWLCLKGNWCLLLLFFLRKRKWKLFKNKEHTHPLLSFFSVFIL